MASDTQQFYSSATTIGHRDEAGFFGVQQQNRGLAPDITPWKKREPSANSVRYGGIRPPDELLAQTTKAALMQQTGTSREYATAATYPSQTRPAEPYRDEKPKNLREFEMRGRDIGLAGVTTGKVGGHVGLSERMRDDLTTGKGQQRTYNDLHYEYHLPTAAQRFSKGPNQHHQDNGRIDAREVSYKNAPGRYTAAAGGDYRLPGNPQDRLAYSEGYAERDTQKSDPNMVRRYRDAEVPNRPGLRMQYADVYSSEWGKMETLERPRRAQHDREQDIASVDMLQPYNTNPYTQLLGQVPPR